jgi:hypothetical protein
MANKMVSKHLVNLENNFATTQPVLKIASEIFHKLDQLEYNLGLLNEDESTACKNSWWPIISLIGTEPSVKNDFIRRYLGSSFLHHPNTYASQHKFTVLQYTPQTTEVTLPGMALDVDHTLPFYQISHKIEQQFSGEGHKINTHLELKTLNSDKLKGKLLIDTPALTTDRQAIQFLLMKHVLDIADLSFVFTDIFDSESIVIHELIDELVQRQDTHNLVYLIDHSGMNLNPERTHEIIHSWQQRLENLGLNTGHYVVLSTSDDSQGINHAIDQRLANVEYDRSYRVLHNLEQSIRDVETVLIPEVEIAIALWKERSNATIFIIMGFLISLMLFAEITMGGIILNSIVDPIIGPLILLILMVVLIPLHIIVSKVHGNFMIKQLYKRQKELHLTESLVGLFEKSLTLGRIILPRTDAFGNNKRTRKKLKSLLNETKELVQALNESFSRIIEPVLSPNITEKPIIPLPSFIPKQKAKKGFFFPSVHQNK